MERKSKGEHCKWLGWFCCCQITTYKFFLVAVAIGADVTATRKDLYN